MCWGDGGDNGAEEAREAEEERQAETIRQQDAINKVFNTYDDDFYTTQRQNYLDYANPQIEEQFTDAMDELRFALARQGISRSSVAADRKKKAQKALDREQTAANLRGKKFSDDIKVKIEQARGTTLDDAGSLADADAAAALATTSAAANAAPPAYEPLYDIFRDITKGLSTQADLERRRSARYDSGLFATNNSSRNVP